MEDFRRWLMLSERNYVDGKPFATSLEALRYIYDNHPSPKNLVVTYTEVDKVGVNPQTQYTTPLGIYFYTAKYVLNKKGKVPLGAERPYMFVCELTRPGKVLHMRRDDDGGEASRLWRSTEDEAWGDENNRGHSMHAGLGAGAMAKVVAWSKALRDAGVSGFIDHGTGTIWPAEPFQGVVFTAGDLRVLHRLENSLRHFQDMPGYDRRGVYAVGATGRGAWQKFLKDVHMAGTDANRSRVVAKATEDAWVLFQDAPERERMRMARIVVRYAELDGEIVQAMMTATDDKVGMAGIIGQANLGMMDGAGVALQLRTAKDVGTLAGVFGRELLNKMDDAQFTSAMGNIRHTFGELYHGGGRSAESFAQAMVSNGRRLSDANVLSLLQGCRDEAERERVSQLVGKARADKVLGGGRRGAQVSEGLRDYLPSGGKPFDPGRRRFMRTAASAALAATAASGAERKLKYQPAPPHADRLIAAVQRRWSEPLGKSGVVIRGEDVAFVKPRDVLAPAWGDMFQSVVDRASAAQREPGTDADQSVTMIRNIDKPIMVIFVDPRKFGLKEAHGFHHFVEVGGERHDYIVVRPDIDEAYLRHEMRHAMQNPRRSGSRPDQFFEDDPDSDPLVGYLTNYPELGVRFAELRLRYYQLTGKVVEDNESDVETMIIHLMRNKERYSGDVRQLIPIMELVESKGKTSQFLRYMRRNMLKYVKGDPSKVLKFAAGADKLA